MTTRYIETSLSTLGYKWVTKNQQSTLEWLKISIFCIASFNQGYNLQSLKSQTDELIACYIKLTKEVTPRMASIKVAQWPVKYDHCFQRIVLDTICIGP